MIYNVNSVRSNIIQSVDGGPQNQINYANAIWSKTDWDRFKEFLRGLDWDFIFGHCDSADKYNDMFLEIINFRVNKFVPRRKINRNPFTKSFANNKTKYPKYIRKLIQRKKKNVEYF